MDQKEKTELLGVMREISLEFDKMDEARDQVKNIVEAASKLFKIPKPLIRKVARFYHKKNISQFESEAGEIKHLYTNITS
jgi:hypothetical protein